MRNSFASFIPIHPSVVWLTGIVGLPRIVAAAHLDFDTLIVLRVIVT
jgi:hypothetical protein